MNAKIAWNARRQPGLFPRSALGISWRHVYLPGGEAEPRGRIVAQNSLPFFPFFSSLSCLLETGTARFPEKNLSNDTVREQQVSLSIFCFSSVSRTWWGGRTCGHQWDRKGLLYTRNRNSKSAGGSSCSVVVSWTRKSSVFFRQGVDLNNSVRKKERRRMKKKINSVVSLSARVGALITLAYLIAERCVAQRCDRRELLRQPHAAVSEQPEKAFTLTQQRSRGRRSFFFCLWVAQR